MLFLFWKIEDHALQTWGALALPSPVLVWLAANVFEQF